MQIVHPFHPKDFKVIDIPTHESLPEALRIAQTTPFNLQIEPGWRASVFRWAEDDYLLSLVMHHIISDGWSLDVLCRDLATFYSAAIHGHDPLSQISPLPIQYRDFAIWQKRDEQTAEHQKQLQYWKKQLADSHPAELLCDKPRPAVLSGEAGAIEVTIEGPLYQSLQQFCRTHQVTPFVVLLAAFRATHYRLTGVEDATIGTPIANRNRQELEDLVGFFVNTQCMRVTIENETFEGLVQQVRSTAAAAFANQDIPFEHIVAELLPGSRDTTRNPLVQLMFAIHSQSDLGIVKLEGVTAEQIHVAATTRFDIEFHLFQGVEKLQGSVLFAVDLFESQTITSMVDIFHEVLRRGLEEPPTPIPLQPLTDGLPTLRDMGLIEIDRTDYPRESSVIDIFCEQVAAYPDTIAVKDSSTQLTYSQLNQQSEKLAAWLRQQEFAAESLIAVLARRSCQTVIAFLGILKANLAYLPLDVKFPPGRIQTILLAVKGNKLVLLGSDVQTPALRLGNVQFVSISNVLQEQVEAKRQKLCEPARVSTIPSATSLAYVMFTSGSTGKPKGVMIEHRGIVRLVKGNDQLSQVQTAVPVAHIANIAFDASTWEIYAALLNGATVVCIDDMTALDNKALDEAFTREKIRAAFFTTAFLKQSMLESRTSIHEMEALYAGGEKMDPRDAYKAREMSKNNFYHVYGPTENTCFSSIYHVSNSDAFANGVAIGRAVSNSGAHVMDPRQRLVPVGVMGELVVTGDGVARGYTDPALDQNRFVHVVIDGKPVKAYRTGDRVRHRPKDGQIEFFGRMDQQVKIRGHRIELAEVEHAMLGHDAINDAAVLVREQEGRGLEMIGFATARGHKLVDEGDGKPHDDKAGGQGEGWTQRKTQLEEQVRSRLQTQLPSYMVPTRIVMLDDMPINANGKVDRRELARRAQTASVGKASSARVGPRNDVEVALCEEFAEILGSELGITDNFFDLGGHSLMATRLVSRVNKRLDAGITVKDIFDQPNVADLAVTIHLSQPIHVTRTNNNQQGAASVPFHLLALEDPKEFVDREIASRLAHEQGRILNVYPVTHVQKKYLQDPTTCRPRAPFYFFFDAPPDLDVFRLKRCFAALIRQFDIFRTVFLLVEDTFYQVVLDNLNVPIDLREIEEDNAQTTDSLRRHDLQRPLHMGHSFFHVAILRKRASTTRVILRLSHTQYDGVCLGHIMRSIHALYNGEDLLTAPKFAQYMQHMENSRQEGYKYWRSILQDSSMTVVRTASVTNHEWSNNDAFYTIEKTIRIPSRTNNSGITQATIFTAACALMLMKATKSSEALFGRVVSGRQNLSTDCQTIVGPCVSVVPVYVRLNADESQKVLTQKIRDQYLKCLPFETLGFDQIKENCTDWPDDVKDYWCGTAYQNVDVHPTVEFHGQQVSMDCLPYEGASLYDLTAAGFPESDGNHVRLSLTASRAACDETKVDCMLNDLCEAMVSLA